MCSIGLNVLQGWKKSKIQGREAKFHGGGFLWYEAFKMKLGCNANEKMRGSGKKYL